MYLLGIRSEDLTFYFKWSYWEHCQFDCLFSSNCLVNDLCNMMICDCNLNFLFTLKSQESLHVL